eukprot:scaffold8464_cov57-Phaeocystis_antarctica.AAC.4
MSGVLQLHAALKPAQESTESLDQPDLPCERAMAAHAHRQHIDSPALVCDRRQHGCGGPRCGCGVVGKQLPTLVCSGNRGLKGKRWSILKRRRRPHLEGSSHQTAPGRHLGGDLSTRQRDPLEQVRPDVAAVRVQVGLARRVRIGCSGCSGGGDSGGHSGRWLEPQTIGIDPQSERCRPELVESEWPVRGSEGE